MTAYVTVMMVAMPDRRPCGRGADASRDAAHATVAMHAAVLDHDGFSTCNRRRCDGDGGERGNDISKLLHSMSSSVVRDLTAHAVQRSRNWNGIREKTEENSEQLFSKKCASRRRQARSRCDAAKHARHAKNPFLLDLARWRQTGLKRTCRRVSRHWRFAPARRIPGGKRRPAPRRLRGSARATGWQNTAATGCRHRPCWSTIPAPD